MLYGIVYKQLFSAKYCINENLSYSNLGGPLMMKLIELDVYEISKQIRGVAISDFWLCTKR